MQNYTPKKPAVGKQKTCFKKGQDGTEGSAAMAGRPHQFSRKVNFVHILIEG